MANSEDATALRKAWNPTSLRQYEGKWIAFRATYALGDLPSEAALQPLLARFQGEIDNGLGPIFAFVTFEEVFV